jgi:hypothetical protein
MIINVLQFHWWIDRICDLARRTSETLAHYRTAIIEALKWRWERLLPLFNSDRGDGLARKMPSPVRSSCPVTVTLQRGLGLAGSTYTNESNSAISLAAIARQFLEE